MSKMIQVRDVPDEVHRVLKTRASASGLSLSDYIKRDLEAAASRATLEEVLARAEQRGPSKVRTQDVIADLRALRDRP